MLLHGMILSAWPRLHAATMRVVIVQGELLPAKISEPVVEPEPPPMSPIPPVQEVPVRQSEDKTPSRKPRQDSGVALPVLAERSDAPQAATNNFVVNDVSPLPPETTIPFASSPGTTPLNQYQPEPASTAGSANGTDDGEGREDQVDHDILAAYGHGLRETAAQLGSYPPLAQKRGWQGRVKVLVRYARSGEAYQISVKNSSGRQILDEAALEMVRKACAIAVLPAALTEKAFSLVVPVDFKLN